MNGGGLCVLALTAQALQRDHGLSCRRSPAKDSGAVIEFLFLRKMYAVWVSFEAESETWRGGQQSEAVWEIELAPPGGRNCPCLQPRITSSRTYAHAMETICKHGTLPLANEVAVINPLSWQRRLEQMDLLTDGPHVVSRRICCEGVHDLKASTPQLHLRTGSARAIHTLRDSKEL